MRGFLIISGYGRESREVACCRSLADAIITLHTFEPGLYTIRFRVDGEEIDLTRYTFAIDNIFSVPTHTKEKLWARITEKYEKENG